jgi:glycosyltransferase involved in cell wall biosynthesis
MNFPDSAQRQLQPIKIIQFWGGVPQSPNSKWLRTLRLVQKCSEQGWKSAVVFADKPQSHDLIVPFLDAGAEILVHQRPPSSLNLDAIIKTYRFLRRHPCDLIHCHNRPAVPLLAAALNRVPIRVWSRLAMSSFYEENKRPTGVHKLQLNIRLSCFFSDKILCISQPVLDELTTLCHSIVKKSVVGGVGFDLESYSSGVPNNIREEFSLSENDLVLVSVGHAVPVKGWDILLLAYSKFQRYFPQSKLLLVGSTELEHEKDFSQSLRQLLETLSLQKNVFFTGKRDDIPDILAVADIYVQPSRSEGLCGALIESLAAGLPCIASNVGGIPDVIQDGKNGLLFERDDVNGLVERMLSLAQNPIWRTTLSSNALPSVQHYGLERVTDAIIETYKDLLTNRRVRET